jgi:AcrR family transcriptional regulator
MRTWFARIRSMFAAVNHSEKAPGSARWWRDRYLERLRIRHRGLSMEQIGQAALKIVDEAGLRELTMRRLADELGTGPASLYRHVASRDELLVEVADLVLGELEAPDPDLVWRDAVEQLAQGLRRVLVGHRGLVVVSSNAPLLGPNAMRIRELFWSVMDRDGCEAEFAVQTYSAVMHFVVCSALFGAGATRKGNAAWSGETNSGLDDLLDLLPARSYPTVLKFSSYAETPNPEHDFTFGLRALLNGLGESQSSGRSESLGSGDRG